MTDISKLQLQIDELVASKTFSLDALDGIRIIRDGLREMTEKNERLQRQYDALCEVNSKQSDELLSKTKSIEALRTDLHAARKLAHEGELAVHAGKTSAAVADAYKDILHTIFKPSAVRESIQRNVAKPVDGSAQYCGTLQTATESETITRTQE